MKLIKKLKRAYALYGATAPYTLTLLDALAVRWLTPHDWKTIVKACLSGGQFILWKAEYEDVAQKQASTNLKRGRNDIVKEKLVGTGDYAALEDQMKLGKEILQLVSLCALGA